MKPFGPTIFACILVWSPLPAGWAGKAYGPGPGTTSCGR